MQKRIAAVLAVFLAAVLCICCAAKKSMPETATTLPSDGGILPSSAPVSATPTMRAVPLRDLPEMLFEERSLCVETGSHSLCGTLYVPQSADRGRVPLVIWAHGLASSGSDGEPYARVFAAHGIACYCFDFWGGGPSSESGGSMLEMSVMTEAADLEAVLRDARTWPFADPDRIVLAGQSQGGLVCAVTAARMPKEVAGLILLYPAFMLPSTLHAQFPSLSDVPDTFAILGVTLGRVYAEDIWDYDLWTEIAQYDSPVLLLHGDEDHIVDISCSRQADGAYSDSRLFVLPGAAHGFFGASFTQACEYIFDYLQQVGILMSAPC